MDVLIITPTRQEYENVLSTYTDRDRRSFKFHHITTKLQMQGYRMPVQIRFVGNWWELEDAPTLEYYAQHIIAAPEGD